MAIVANFYGAGLHREQYEALRNEIGWEKRHPEGGILHLAAFDTQGDTHVTDVWESQQQLDAFVGEHLMPAMQRLNIAPPKVDVYPLHNLNAYASIDRFLVK